jgi:hypothetical protein
MSLMGEAPQNAGGLQIVRIWGCIHQVDVWPRDQGGQVRPSNMSIASFHIFVVMLVHYGGRVPPLLGDEM